MHVNYLLGVAIVPALCKFSITVDYVKTSWTGVQLYVIW